MDCPDLVRHVAQALEGLRVGVADPAVGVDDEQDARVGLERDAEARLIIEAGLRFGELVALVLEHALQHVAFEDCLLAFGGTGGLLGQQSEEHAVVLHEQRIATCEHRQRSNRQFVPDRHGEAGRFSFDGGIAQGRRLADRDRHGWGAGDRSGDGRVPSCNDCAPGAGDSHRRLGERLPERIGFTVRRRDERLSEVERRGALLKPPQGLRRHERHQVGQPRREGEQPRDHDQRSVGRLPGRGERAGNAREQDRGGEQQCADRRDPQARACIADPVSGGPPEQDRPNALEEHETADDQGRCDRVPARADGERDDQRRRRCRPGPPG